MVRGTDRARAGARLPRPRPGPACPARSIIAGYLAFVTALAHQRDAGRRPPGRGGDPRRRHHVAGAPAADLAGAGGGWRAHGGRARTAGGGGNRCCPDGAPAAVDAEPHPERCAVAACDAASGPHLILIGLLIAGPCCALLTGRWALTAAASGFALALGVRARGARPDLRHRHPVRVPSRRRGRRRGCHHRRRGPPAPAPLNLAAGPGPRPRGHPRWPRTAPGGTGAGRAPRWPCPA